MTDDRSCSVDTNPDPITNEPGSHPLGTAVGSAGGAAGGALIGSMFGPIGMMIGGGLGAIAGGGAGHAVGEMLNPTLETEYWRAEHADRKYFITDKDYDRDYLPAYRYGWETRAKYPEAEWDDKLENKLEQAWDEIKADSTLMWNEAKEAVRDAWHRSDKTYRVYDEADRYFENHYWQSDYYEKDFTYADYRPAYRYGTYVRTVHDDCDWDDRLEHKLEQEWEDFKGDSRLTWNKAKHAVRDAWHSVERVLPGDFDNDGR